MAAKISLEEAVNFLAQNNFEVEDGLERIVWLRQSAGEEIRLIEVNRNGFPIGRVEAFYFAPSAEVPFETYLADITPKEWQKILSGEIPLPKNWSLEGSMEFFPPEKETVTLKKAAEDLGVSLEDRVSYQRRGDKALIEIDLKLPSSIKAENVASEAIAASTFQ